MPGKLITANWSKRILWGLALTVILIVPCSAFGDKIELKNGEAFEGNIIAEEEERIQLKLDSSGACLWFSRDQISSIEKSSDPEDDSTADDNKKAPADSPDDDEARAQKLLDSLKKQQTADEQEMALPEPPVIGPESAPVTIEAFMDYQ